MEPRLKLNKIISDPSQTRAAAVGRPS